ncbi:MAG: AEC family transporter [Synergistaceae bacterium]|jgi:predicted permease|nr:AEC family transporter [Synergistaceae bacterium]
MILQILLWSFNAVAPVLFAIVLGWLIAFRGHIAEDDRTFLNRLCFKYLLPAQLLANTLSIDFTAGYNVRLLVYCAGGILATAAAAWVLFTVLIADRPKRAIFILSAFRTNNILYGMPLAANLFGAEGVAVAVMVYPITIVSFNALTVATLVYFSQSGAKSGAVLKKTLLDVAANPLIVACLLGTFCAAAGITIPRFLKGGLDSVGAAATPVALLLLGSQIDAKKLSGNLRPALAACVLRLVLVPAALLAVVIPAGFRGPELSALMVAFAAPSAVTNMVMARNYNVAPDFAAQTVYLSTIFSLGTIFLFIVFLRFFGLM